MSARTRLSRIIKNGRVELNWDGSWVQLTSLVTENLTAPIKIYVVATYTGIVGVAISAADNSQIREVSGGVHYYFDEVDTPSKLYINPNSSEAAKYLYWRCGEY